MYLFMYVHIHRHTCVHVITIINIIIINCNCYHYGREYFEFLKKVRLTENVVVKHATVHLFVQIEISFTLGIELIC